MNSLHQAILTLRRQRKETERTLARLDAALAALNGAERRGKRHLSKAARKRISLAQKKRWAAKRKA